MNPNEEPQPPQPKRDGNNRRDVLEKLKSAYPSVRFTVTEGAISRYSSARYENVTWTKTKITWTDGPPTADIGAVLEGNFVEPPGGYRLRRKLTDQFAAAHAYRARNRGQRPRASINDATDLTERERAAGTFLVALCGQQTGGQRELLFAQFLTENGVDIIDTILDDD